jgi:nitrite reductase (NADH) small subunit/3-phenylpropionate/trans-cinnamate dioxygenase ferredoxin subunit
MVNDPTNKQFHRVAKVSEIPSQSGKTVSAGEREVAVFNLNGAFYAMDDFCPHRGASLGAGFLEGEKVFCPWHCFDFHLKTGACEIAPGLRVQTYEVKVEGEEVFVLC